MLYRRSSDCLFSLELVFSSWKERKNLFSILDITKLITRSQLWSCCSVLVLRLPLTSFSRLVWPPSGHRKHGISLFFFFFSNSFHIFFLLLFNSDVNIRLSVSWHGGCDQKNKKKNLQKYLGYVWQKNESWLYHHVFEKVFVLKTLKRGGQRKQNNKTEMSRAEWITS